MQQLYVYYRVDLAQLPAAVAAVTAVQARWLVRHPQAHLALLRRPELREAWLGFEAGVPPVDVRVGGWADLQTPAMALRHAVFAEEQGIPANLMSDPADTDATHAVAFNRLGLAVATGRWVPHAPGVAKVGRMAVHAGLRGNGLGRQVLQGLVDSARQAGCQQVLLHAQASAVGFYQRLGYQAVGAAFEEAGIQHQAMTLAI